MGGGITKINVINNEVDFGNSQLKKTKVKEFESFELKPYQYANERIEVSRHIRSNSLIDLLRAIHNDRSIDSNSAFVTNESTSPVTPHCVDLSNLSFRSLLGEVEIVDDNEVTMNEYKFYTTSYK